jgi:uncharacterized protein involved in type VI secretion and phage assembly
MVHIDLLKLMHGDLAAEREKDTYGGVTIGIVTSIEDDEHLGRIRVKFPYIGDGMESGWARLSTPWAGSGRGHYFVPEVDDEVLVAFQDGDVRHPYILGCLWSSEALPPQLDPALQKREIRSKSGHTLAFDDSEGRETVTLQSQGGHSIVLDDTTGAAKISIVDSTTNFSVVIDVGAQKISITSPAQLSIEATKLSLHGKMVDIKADGTLSLSGDTAVSINGQAVKIN